MKYLFFDIECAGVYKNVAKICAFGYCLVDEQFNILAKEDLLINPQGSFHLTDRKGEQGLVLPYKYADFKSYPAFTQYADKIYGLLQEKDTLVVGHASMNDVKYLNLESQRFNLPSFHFQFADTQFLYMNKIGDFSRQFALGVIAEKLGVNFTPHCAVDDAYATMKTAQALCKDENLSLDKLLKKYNITLGKIENYQVTQNTSLAFEKFKKDKEKAKHEREKKRVAFHIFCDKQKRYRQKEGKLKGKLICLSHTLELDEKLAQKLVKGIFALAGQITFKSEECTLYVSALNETGPRIASVLKKGVPVLSVEQFLQMYFNE